MQAGSEENGRGCTLQNVFQWRGVQFIPAFCWSWIPGCCEINRPLKSCCSLGIGGWGMRLAPVPPHKHVLSKSPHFVLSLPPSVTGSGLLWSKLDNEVTQNGCRIFTTSSRGTSLSIISQASTSTGLIQVCLKASCSCLCMCWNRNLCVEVEGLLEEIHHSDIHHCGPMQNEVNESDIKVPLLFFCYTIACGELFKFCISNVMNHYPFSRWQFSHSVYVKAFSRKIYSVWIAVACLSRKLRWFVFNKQTRTLQIIKGGWSNVKFEYAGSCFVIEMHVY